MGLEAVLVEENRVARLKGWGRDFGGSSSESDSEAEEDDRGLWSVMGDFVGSGLGCSGAWYDCRRLDSREGCLVCGEAGFRGALMWRLWTVVLFDAVRDIGGAEELIG